MLEFHRHSFRHRLLIYSDTHVGRYEVEQRGWGRWYIRLNHDGQAWAVGEVDGYVTVSAACGAAESHFVALIEDLHEKRRQGVV
jgi:hypothetical protein